MRGIFAITKAEFIKIFKKPTVYIMAFILVLTCVLSLFVFKPNSREDYRVTLSTENALANYEAFMSNSGSDNKSIYDSTIDEANALYNYIKNAENRDYNMNFSVNSLINSLNSLSTSSPSSIASIQQNLNNVLECYTSHYGLESVPYYAKLITLTNTSGEVIYLKDYAKLEVISNQINELIANSEADEVNQIIKQYIQENDVIKKLNDANKNYINYINVIIENILTDLSNTHDQFISSIQKHFENGDDIQLQAEQVRHLKNILILINNYKDVIDLLSSPDYPVAIISNASYENFMVVYSRIKKIVDVGQNIEKFSVRKQCANELSADNYRTQLNSTYNSLKFVNISSKDLMNTLKDYKKQTEANAEIVYKSIFNLRNEASTSKICEEITNYKLLSQTYKQLVEDNVTQAVVSNLTSSEIKEIKNYNLKDYSEYEIKERISKNIYYLKTNTYSTNYLLPFNFNGNSAYKTNVYDYMYFALKICTLLIIVFTMFMLASIITAEQDQGTIKLLLVRPFSRSKILSAKLLATFFFSFCFLALSTIITFVGGYFRFGLPALEKVLLTFNATSTFAISPIWAMLIFMASNLLDIIFYLIVATLLSVAFKSYASAITTSLITVIISILISIFLANSVVYAFLPFTTISLFRFFGNSFLPTGDSILNAFFLMPISPGMSIISSVLVSGIFCLVIYIISFNLFNKRDF